METAREHRSRVVRPVFIAGCDRSGTTLLGAMLGAHTDCVCTPESQFIIEVLRELPRELNNIDVVKVLSKIKDHWRFKLWNLDVCSGELSCLEPTHSYGELIEWVVERYRKRVEKPRAHIWVDHTPTLIQHASRLFEIFPSAKIIHIIRDGRAVANSVIPLDWGPNTILAAAHWWGEKVSYGFAVELIWGENCVLRVRYEDLVEKPKMTLEKICAYIGIDYQSNMQSADGFRVPEYTGLQHRLVSKGLVRDRVNAWQRHLTSRQIELFEGTTGDMLRYLGYRLQYGLSARPATSAEAIVLTLKELFLKTFNILRSYQRRKHFR